MNTIYWKVTMQISATEFNDITVPADSIKDAWSIAMSEVNGVVIAINLLANQQDKIQALLNPALAAPEPDDTPDYVLDTAELEANDYQPQPALDC